MIEINKTEELISAYKQFINNLSKIQEASYRELVEKIPLMDIDGEDFLFDYVFNFSSKEFPTFSDYMKRFNPVHASTICESQEGK
jgi:hypothetical protein